MEDCIFCKIINNQIPAKKIIENDTTIVINDLNPQAPKHFLAIPRKHYSGIHEVPPEDHELLKCLFNTIGEAVKKEDLLKDGYRLVLNFGEKTGQSVNHIHVHILSGRSMHWPPG